MDKIIGRKEEIAILEKIKVSNKPEFVAVYGRRRVGKTYLIRQFFKQQFTFHLTGMANANTPLQLGNFISTYREFNHLSDERVPQNWFEAFALLKHLIESKGEKLCIVFLDELPWMDTPRSNFVMALEHFWNSYGSSKNNLKLITCGSVASWMINKLINNHGGLHNRVTKRIHIHPFTLDETQQFLQAKNIVLERYQIAELYLILGGIPFYLEEVEEGLSVAQNIDRLCFSETGLFRNEYQNLFKSLFKDSKIHQAVVEALAGKSRGLQRDEIIKLAKIPNGGNTTKVLEELESSGFIRKYVPFNNKIRSSLYQLTDPFVLFYHQFMKNTKAVGEGAWLSFVDGSPYKTWTGYAFENLCLLHIAAIKMALGINGIYSENASWRSKENNAQIDLLIDRKDKVITICEMKFSNDEFVITKDYADKLRRKLNVFRTESKTKKSVFLCMITTFGIQTNQYSLGLVQNSLTLEDLFAK